MKNILLNCIMAYLLVACDNSSVGKERNIPAAVRDFGLFSLSLPTDWQEIKQDGPDFSFSYYVDSDKDTFGLYIGRFASFPEFSETIVFEPSFRQHFDSGLTPPSDPHVIGEKRKMDRNRINTRNILFEKINGVNCRFIFPRDRNAGDVRFYVDSLGPQKEQIDFWGTNLSIKKQETFFTICRTLRSR